MSNVESGASFILRQMTIDDHPMVYNSWLKSYRDSPMVKGVPNTAYYNAHHKVISIILDASPNQIVACNPEDPSTIFGYLVGTQSTPMLLHWVYVKHAFRGWGIAASLYGAWNSNKRPFLYTHRTKNSEYLLGDRQGVFNPYAAFGVPI